MAELERMRRVYLAAEGGRLSNGVAGHPMVDEPKRRRRSTHTDDQEKLQEILDDLNESGWKRQRAHARRLDLALAIQQKAQHIAVEAERNTLEGHHRGPFMPAHVRERLEQIAALYPRVVT